MKVWPIEKPQDGATPDSVSHVSMAVYAVDQTAESKEFETCILVVADDCHRDGAVVLPLAGKQVIQASRQVARNMGQVLHHAEWTITSEADRVRTLGSAHGCPACIAATDQATALLAEHPEKVIAIGQLWWVTR